MIMKKTASIITTMAISALVAVSLAGCSGDSTSASASSASASGSAYAEASGSSAAATATSASAGDVSASSASSSLFSNDGWPQNEITADVPVPEFSVGPSSISSTETSVSLSYDNVPEAEASTFIEVVKAAGFTYGASEQRSTASYSYSACNAEDILQSTGIVIGYSSTGSLNISVTNAKLM